MATEIQALTDADLDLIDTRAAHLYEYVDLSDDAEILAGTDVPALLAEIRRLRARVAELEVWECDAEGCAIPCTPDCPRASERAGGQQ